MEAGAIMEMVRREQEKYRNSPTSTLTFAKLEDYGLGGVDCDVCENKGYVVWLNEDGIAESRECECMAKRRSLRKIRESGMSDMIERYTFDTFETPDEQREKIKNGAERFANCDTGWMYIYGRSGSGKTHICTAVCVELIARGIEVYYMSWRDESTAIKGMVMDSELYARKIRKFKTVLVLYIDDFFKGGHTDADVRLAFEILNARYNDTKLRTIISSEMSVSQLISIDEALGGRIYERSRGNVINTPDMNWRLR